jgi:ABC-2 type transport system ATP-binding protein
VKIACGLVRPTSGTVEVGGDIGYLAETFRFPDWMTADELLGLHQRLAKSDGGAAERARLLEDVDLARAKDTRVEAMSKGMQQRLGIAQAIIGAPKLLLLDEPTSALDPVGRRIVRSLLEDLRSRGVSVLLNSHLLSEVELVCDRVVIVRDGRVIVEGAPRDLARPRGVEIETDAGTTVHEDVARDDVPALVARLVAEGRQVYGVRLLTSTLEEVYLEAVGG